MLPLGQVLLGNICSNLHTFSPSSTVTEQECVNSSHMAGPFGFLNHLIISLACLHTQSHLYQLSDATLFLYDVYFVEG
jgi:hypothetical protein